MEATGNEALHPLMRGIVQSVFDAPRIVREARVSAYVQALERHDWAYEFSDDFGVWKRGLAERREIEAMARELDPDCTLWNAHCAEGFERGAV